MGGGGGLVQAHCGQLAGLGQARYGHVRENHNVLARVDVEGRFISLRQGQYLGSLFISLRREQDVEGFVLKSE